MKADTYELKTILTLERRYVIPTFQRDYEWTEDGQWELLFDDLESVADKLGAKRREFEAAGQPVAKADQRVAPHFLGAIVLDRLPTSPSGSLDARSVIDGQQRLTTIQLHVRAVLDVLTEIGSRRVHQVRRLIQNPSDITPNSGGPVQTLAPSSRSRRLVSRYGGRTATTCISQREPTSASARARRCRQWALWVSNPIRPRSAASRNRVMRGPGVTPGAKRSQGARRPRD